LRLRGVGFDVVAVQVEVLRGRAPPHLFRADLVRPVPAPEALVTVDVERWHEYKRCSCQRAGRRRAVEQLAQRDHARVLTVYFTGMNAALHEHDRPLRTMSRRGIERAVR